MDYSELIIETENLFLKPISFDHQEDIFKEFTPEITVFMFSKAPDKIEETIAFIETASAKNKAGQELTIEIVDKKNGEFLGCGGLHPVNCRTPELGIWIKKSAHGHGYGKEAMVALKKWADENIDYDYILYPVDRQNYPSRRIPEFLGGKIFTEYEKINRSGNKLNIVEYRIYNTKK
jgi:[ribosomal protein S5]-alanine N-acetyltransferase